MNMFIPAYWKKCLKPITIVLLLLFSGYFILWIFGYQYHKLDYVYRAEDTFPNQAKTINQKWYHIHNSLPFDETLCHRLLTGKKRAIRKANRLNKRYKQEYLKTFSTTLRYLLNATTICGSFKKQQGYWTGAVSKEEEQLPIAYSILVYRNVDQVERLLRAIYRPNNVYCIHIDSKALKIFKVAVKMVSDCFTNVFIAHHPVIWGKFSVVQAELSCWRILLESQIKWKYLINLTGQEYPLKTNFQLVKILKALNGTNNVNFKKIQKLSYNLQGKPVKQVTPPHNITIIRGSTHLAVTRGFVEYTLYHPIAQDWIKWCQALYIPDERCFTTLNYNRHLKVPGAFIGNPHNIPKLWWIMRYKVWIGRKAMQEKTLHAQRCAGTVVRNVCNIGPGDLYKVSKSRKLFLNKIKLEDQPIAYNCMEHWLRSLKAEDPKFSTEFYQNISSKRSFD